MGWDPSCKLPAGRLYRISPLSPHYFPFHARHFSPGLTGNNSLPLPSLLFCWRALKGSKSMPISQVLEGGCRSGEGELGQNLTCKQRTATLQAHARVGGHPRCTRADRHLPGQLPVHTNMAHDRLHTALKKITAITLHFRHQGQWPGLPLEGPWLTHPSLPLTGKTQPHLVEWRAR